jgi:phosphatidylglycerol---prolipoprotein diacylglyceryl transferase
LPIPFEPTILGIKINTHLVFEYLAFFIAFQYYRRSRNGANDTISKSNRLSIILGAIAGAFIGSRLAGFLENPMVTLHANQFIQLFNTKSIMGGLFGGLIGVEIAKKIINEKQSSGDLFTFPIIIGIMIGRIGCFLTGVNEFTYGKETSFITGIDLGDGLSRHPTALYELVFLLLLFILLKKLSFYTKKENGLLFKLFMLSYFGFRFLLEFLKPNIFFVLGLSSIQWLCLICWIYYIPTLKKLTLNAR